MGLLANCGFLLHGTKYFGKDAFARAAKTFDNSFQTRTYEGVVCVVTGANAGLGLQTSEMLAKQGCTVHMVCRNAEKGQAAVEQIKDLTGNPNILLKVCDVSSLEAVASLASDYANSEEPVHVLINNAGVMYHEPLKSADGYDLNFATNTLGCFALTYMMEPVLKRSAPSKVIFVSSGGMLSSPLDTKHLDHEDLKPYDGTKTYARDKRRQVVLAELFAELWRGSGVDVYSCHPGWAETPGVKQSIPGFYNFFKDKFRDPEQGADTIVWLALEDASKLVSGEFYGDRAVHTKHLRLAGTHYKKEQADELWQKLLDILQQHVKPHPEAPVGWVHVS